MPAKIEDLTQHGLEWGQFGIGSVAMSNCLVTNAIFLVGEVEQYSLECLGEDTFRGCCSIEQPHTGFEGDIL